MKKLSTFILAFLYTLNTSSQVQFEKSPKRSERILASTASALKDQPIYNPLSDAYDVKFYGIDLEADNTSVYLSGNVTIGATVTVTELDTFAFELYPSYTIDSIRVNGNTTDFMRNGDDVLVPLESPFGESDWIETQIFYHGSNIRGGTVGIRYYALYPITYTLTEPLYAKDWFPCKQELTDKADSAYIFITTNESFKVASNGLLTATVPLGGGKVRYEWKTHYPIAYYLISMAISDYTEYNIYAKPTGLEDSILIQNYVYNETVLDDNKTNIDITADLIEIYSELFGMYPFKDEKYGHVMAPIGGGMEHQTMTTISDFDFMLVSHELAHMWFGDYVTCATWQDIWINEGFATYSHLLSLEQLEGTFPAYYSQFYIDDITSYTLGGSVYVPENQFDIDYSREVEVDALTYRIFDWYLSYEKGAIILHMLRYELNDDELFFNILRNYLNQFQFGNAKGIDFKSVAENLSGKDFTGFFDQWYFGEGYPKYNIQWFQEGDTLYIRSVQTPSASSTPLFKMNMDYQLVYPGNDTIIRLYQNENIQIHKVYIPENVSQINIDPNSWVLIKLMNITNEEFPSALPEKSTEIQTFEIYPNPITDRLYIKMNNNIPIDKIAIYDISGHYLIRETPGSTTYTMNLTGLKKGIYYIEIQTDTERITRKILKN